MHQLIRLVGIVNISEVRRPKILTRQYYAINVSRASPFSTAGTLVSVIAVADVGGEFG